MKSLVKKYEYIGGSSTKVKVAPYTNPIPIMTGDKVISVIELSPRFFSEVDIDPMEVLCTLIDTGLVEVRKSVSNEELIESLEAEQIDVPVGATRGEIVVLCVENQLSPE